MSDQPLICPGCGATPGIGAYTPEEWDDLEDPEARFEISLSQLRLECLRMAIEQGPVESSDGFSLDPIGHGTLERARNYSAFVLGEESVD